MTRPKFATGCIGSCPFECEGPIVLTPFNGIRHNGGRVFSLHPTAPGDLAQKWIINRESKRLRATEGELPKANHIWTGVRRQGFLFVSGLCA